MGYIQELRSVIGSRPIIGVGATVVVRRNQNELLLNLRSDTNTWGIPGGAMELGETIEDTARRELYEETGLQAKDYRLLGVLSGPAFFFVYPNGDQMHGVAILYEATGVTGELRINDDESLRLAYFHLDELPELESRAEAVVRWLIDSRS